MAKPVLPANLDGSEVAIVGMACRFPGARNVEEFWRNLRDGVESIARLSDAELARAGVPPALLARPNYVKAAPVIEGYDRFDAEFFGYSALEARLMDPQQRLLLETAFAALESAGYVPERFDGAIGVFAGSKTNTYLFHLASRPELLQGEDFFQLVLGGDQAMVSTRISFKLGLQGPSYGVQTACSTSLVAVHLACQSLQLGECRMALAGGAALEVPHGVGYLCEEGGILSPDGHCRPFDAGARGTVFGSGVGVVVLKRLEDALADGDHVSAVILGSATNNDGSDKATFTAPSVAGQTAVILDALAYSGVEADTISYVEAHGTGTELGDPIEVLALTNAFRASTERRGFCGLGSVKSNVGHLDAAAGMASLIKAVLALERGELPPTLHFEKPNPKIDFESSPFFVADRRRPWPRGSAPRRAGVSSLGFGGTNAHVILQEAPAAALPDPAEAAPARPDQLLVLSARSPAALDELGRRLADHLEACGPPAGERWLADAAYTLQVGRRGFDHRRAVVAADAAAAARALRGEDASCLHAGERREGRTRALFLFPGQGAQYVGMGRGLYDGEEVFRSQVDRCAELLEPHLGRDLRELLYPAGGEAEAAEALRQTAVTQPALFVIELALARLWTSWGIRPEAMIGHSIGEYVAACLAGVFPLADALMLVAERGRRMQELPGGAMLAVRLAEEELRPRLPAELSLAAVNGPRRCVVSGPGEAVAAFAGELAAEGVESRPLHTSHAFHSAAMDPLLEAFAERVGEVSLGAPAIPFLSNLTGTWITAGEATDPGYWARHLRAAVRFGDGLAEVLPEAGWVPFEVGPGTTLATFVREHPARRPETVTLPSLPHPNDVRSDPELLLGSLGRAWIAGLEVDWRGFHGGTTRRRMALPTYPFEGRRHWIDLAPAAPPAPRLTLDRVADPGGWLYRPKWLAATLPAGSEPAADGGPWLLFCDPGGLGAALAEALRSRGQTVFRAEIGEAWRAGGDGTFELRPDEPAHYDRLLAALAEDGTPPARIVHLWSVGEVEPQAADRYDLLQARGFYSLLFLLQALGKRDAAAPVELTVFSTGVQPVLGDEPLVPERATLLGPVKVGPKEIPGLAGRSVDLPADAAGDPYWSERLLAELAAGREPVVAWRGGERWVESFAPAAEEATDRAPITLRPQGVYLVTGGLGGVGSTLAEHLAREVRARLVLTARHELPPRSAWPEILRDAGEDGAVADRIRRVQRLEELGAEVLVQAADAADRDAMARVIAAAEERFGSLDGVIHAAGIAGGGMLQLKTAQAAARVIDPKVRGTLVLEDLLDGEDLDFLLLVSSLQTVLGDFGQVDYCGANAFLDAFAARQTARGRPVVAVDWDNWRDLGILVTSELPPHLESWREELLAKAIAPSEAVEVLRRVLARPAARWVVSAQELAGRIELSRSFTGGAILEQLGGGKPAAGPAATAAPLPRGGELERRVRQVWQRVLELETLDVHDNFFDLGGDSLTGMRLVSELNRELGLELSPVQLYELPTVAALVERLSPGGRAAEKAAAAPRERAAGGRIAIIGMAGRFPGAGDVDELWRNLCAGVESIRFFTDEELLAAGVERELLERPNYVKARAVIEGAELFDADFFGCTPREAEVMDPQHRLFLECAWQALEDAGYDPSACRGAVGVYAGSSISTYLQNLYSNPDLIRDLGDFQAMLANEKDSLPTRVSYKLNLTGPSLAVQTYCSTSLVAVHLACQALRQGECDLALAGGASINVPQTSGYLYDEGSFLSGDGHVRTFDAAAQGIVFGDGLGVVVLKRLEDALADGDEIEAVVAGSAINNDGSLKAGFVAPSVDGQAQVIRAALAAAAVSAESIGYVEAHGTGTPLGDPIEIAALTRAWSADTDRKAFCPIGSVKTNFGHLDRAAGVASLIKTVLALRHGKIPPSLHFETPNPKIDFAGSPFFVNTELVDWRTNGHPRRAGVSSLGIGGTNAHVILEEAPLPAEPSPPGREAELIVLSARTAGALERATARLVDFLAARPGVALADVAFTLQVGRRPFEHRRTLVAGSREEVVAALGAGDPQKVRNATVESASRGPGGRRVVFLFPGLGGQYVDMALGLYRGEEVFRREVDRCCELLEPHLGSDLRGILFPRGTAAGSSQSAGESGVDLRRMLGREGGREDAADLRLRETRFSQPAVFVVEYALARLWMSWGIVPEAMVGYSIGEFVAACLAGVLSLEDALALVADRARRIHELPAGAMLAVSLAEEDVGRYLSEEVSLSGVNAPEQTVLAGPVEALRALEERLAGDGVSCRRLQTTHAFHSRMMEPCFDRLVELARGFDLRPPRIPYLSNVTGDWITAEEAADPTYWARHMCRPVRFTDAVSALRQDPDRLFLEVGPGQTLASLVLQHPAGPADRPALAAASLRHAYETQSDSAFLLASLGKLWLAGVEVDWQGFHGGRKRRRLSLPTYAFERRRHWIEKGAGYRRTSERRGRPRDEETGLRREGTYLVLGGTSPLDADLARFLAASVSARLVLIAPSAAARDQVETLAELGAEVLSLDGELDGERLLGEALESAYGRFGLVHGLIWTADLPAAEAGDAVDFLPRRVRQLEAIAAAVGGEPLDFALLVTSAAEGTPTEPADAAWWRYLDAWVDRRPGDDDALDWRHAQARIPPAEPVAEPVLRALFAVGGEPRPADRREVTEAPADREVSSRPLGADYAAPRDEIEQRIAALWEELLGVSPVGRHDNFLEIGGDSLLATRLIGRMRDEFEVELPVRQFFEGATVAELARSLHRIAGREVPAAGERRARPPRRIPRRPELPAVLSFAQERLWFLDQLDPGNPAYNVPAFVELRGELDRPLLRRCLNELVRRHESLRTTFGMAGGQARQHLAPHLELDLPRVDLRRLGSAERGAEVRRLARRASQAAFDLGRGPLVAMVLLETGAGEHTAILTLHHIVCDTWSINILVAELAALYEARRAGRPSPLPELPIRYADFAVWERERMADPAMAAQLAYWRAAFAELPELLELPTDRPRPAVQSSWGARQFLRFSGELHERLRGLARRSQSSLFMTLLAAWSVLLGRYSRQREIVTGTPVANRDREELEGLVGPLLNTVLLRADLGGDPPFEELLERVKTMALGAFSHQDFPYARLVEELQPERDLGRNPLFQVQLILQSAPRSELRVEGLTFRPLDVDPGTVQFDLSLQLTEMPDGLVGWLEYDADLFDATTVRRLSSHFERLLGAAADEPEKRLHELPLTGPAERFQVVGEWNDTAADACRRASVLPLIEARARRRPEAVALIFEEEHLSFGELMARANQLAHALAAQGVGPGDVVGISAWRCPELVVGLLAIWKAGGAYLPLDPETPPERLQMILEDARVERVLEAGTPAAGTTGWPEATTRVRLDGGSWAFGDYAATDPGVTLGAESPAYVIYTSGSTGVPKGVVGRHGGVANRLLWMPEAMDLSAEDRFLQKTAFTFDVSVWELFVPPMIGAPLVLARPGGQRDPAYLAELIAGRRITTVHFVASMLGAFLDAPASAELGGLARVVTSGEAVSTDLEDRCLERLGADFYNLYGPTEASIEVTSWLCSRRRRRPRVPIGRPLANVRIHLLDPRLQALPIGVPGELHIGGVCLAGGYLGRPALTAEVFVPDPFSAAPGGRLYKTGDVARHLAGGEIDFLGRIDHQVKIRGFRVELGEIEVALRSHEAVHDTVVTTWEPRSARRGPGDVRLAAYVVFADAARAGDGAPPVDPRALRAHLAERLPAYMIPTDFVVLDALPLTASGKIDRRRLPAPTSADAAAGGDTAARNPTEELMAGIWNELLGVDRLGMEDNLFERGAHSLLATQAMSRIRDLFHVELPIRAFFEAPTVAGLARRVDGARKARAGVEAEPIARVPRDRPLLLSFTQERMWFLEQLYPGMSAYNVPGAVHLRGELDHPVLERSLSEIVRRHEIFRTTFEARGEHPVQVIAPAAPFVVPVVDLGALRADERERTGRRLVEEAARRPFDLARGPMLRIFLIRLAEDHRVLNLTTHHVTYDMWAREIFIREIAQLYDAFTASPAARGAPCPLAEPALQYADFAAWQRHWMRGPVLAEQLDYWKNKLRGMPNVLDLPTDRPRPPIQTFGGDREYFDVEPPVARALRSLGQQRGVTPFMVLLAAYQTLMFRYSGQRRVVVGTPIANRNRSDTENLIGFFANALALATELAPDLPFPELLERVRETTLEAYDHQDLPLEFLVEEIQPERDLSRQPIFQVMLNYLPDYGTTRIELKRLTLTFEEVHNAGAPYDLFVSMWPHGEGLRGSVHYNTDLFVGTTVRRLGEHFRTLLAAIAEDPGRELASYGLMPAAERHQLLVEWNDSRTGPGADAVFPELFEAQAGRTPEAVAVALGDAALSYRQLAARADVLARRLRGSGVAPGTVVALFTWRSPEFLTAVLALFKAGSAYLPLDPRYPIQRHLQVLERSAVPWVITTREFESRVVGAAGELPAVGRPRVLVIEDALDGSVDDARRETGGRPRAAAAELAYVIFTSGSTGVPKGAMVEQRGMVNHLRAKVQALALGAGDRVLQNAAQTFDISVWQFLAALLVGGRVEIVSDEVAQDASRLLSEVAGRRVTIFETVPSLLRILMEEIGQRPAERPDFSALRWLVPTGEALPPELCRDWLEHFPEVPLLNAYGPTECSDDVTHQPLRRPGRWSARRKSAHGGIRVTIGRPLPNLGIHCFDRWLGPVPVGIPGELCVAGVGVGRGYLHEPRRTAEAFLPDPFARRPGGRLYRTGDLARRLADGEVDFLGRIDHQVKVRGFRIELGEIESVLGSHPAVREAVVVTREIGGRTGDPRLVAYLTGDELDVDVLRRFVGDKLPDYMVPAAFVVLAALPLNPNGKIDRRALPAPDASQLASGEEFVAPRTATENELARIWAELLGIERVGAGDNFFYVGGHSLLATRLISQVRERFAVELPLATVFEGPTLAELAEAIEVAGWAAEVDEAAFEAGTADLEVGVL